MKEQIKLKLKSLAIAYEAAKNYDYCPEAKLAREIKQDYLFSQDYSIEQIESACKEYQGWKPYEIADKLSVYISNI